MAVTGHGATGASLDTDTQAVPSTEMLEAENALDTVDPKRLLTIRKNVNAVSTNNGASVRSRRLSARI